MIHRSLAAGIVLALSLCGPGTASFAAEDALPATGDIQPASARQTISSSRMTPLVRAVQRARTATVNIHSEKRAKASETLFTVGRDRKVNGMGTGIVIDSRGYIVTNNHVVAEVDALRVTLFDGSSYDARVISYDSRRDLAIIKIDATRPLDVMPMGTSSDLLLGEDVLAIGNAFGYEHTVTRGIISALSRDVEVNEEQSYENLIQIDAAINPGNSGGPLLNRDGDVIGINVAIRAGAQKIGFAIPIDDARRIIVKLLNIERLDSTTHGIVGRDIKVGAERRLVVDRVIPGSPADRAGIMPGDVIVHGGELKIVDAADLERALLGVAAGEAVPLKIRRGDGLQDVNLTLAKLGDSESQPARQRISAPIAKAEPKAAGSTSGAWNVLGMRLARLQEAQAGLVGPRYRGGMLVTDVRRDSPADMNGIKQGDILVGLHVWETVSRENIEYVVTHPQLTDFNPLKFYIFRDGETLYGHFALNQPAVTASR